MMCSASRNGQPFSMMIVGRKHYVFNSLADIATIHKKSSLDIKNFVILLYSSLFGMSKKDAAQLDAIKPKLHDLNTKYLLTSKNNAVEASRYFTALNKQFNALDDEIKESAKSSVTKDGFVFVTDTQGTSTVRAYFGQTLLDLDPKLLKYLSILAGEGLWPLLSGAPHFFFPKPITARERAVQNYRDWIKMAEKDDSLASPFLVSRINLLREQGFGEDARARELLSLLFG
jgi:hypothetical protein